MGGVLRAKRSACCDDDDWQARESKFHDDWALPTLGPPVQAEWAKMSGSKLLTASFSDSSEVGSWRRRVCALVGRATYLEQDVTSRT